MEQASSQISAQVCLLNAPTVHGSQLGLWAIKFIINFTCFSKCDFPNNGTQVYNVISLEIKFCIP